VIFQTQLWVKPDRMSRSLIPIRRNQSRKVEILNTEVCGHWGSWTLEFFCTWETEQDISL